MILNHWPHRGFSVWPAQLGLSVCDRLHRPRTAACQGNMTTQSFYLRLAWASTLRSEEPADS